MSGYEWRGAVETFHHLDISVHIAHNKVNLHLIGFDGEKYAIRKRQGSWGSD
jgi:hypothetical protein